MGFPAIKLHCELNSYTNPHQASSICGWWEPGLPTQPQLAGFRWTTYSGSKSYRNAENLTKVNLSWCLSCYIRQFSYSQPDTGLDTCTSELSMEADSSSPTFLIFVLITTLKSHNTKAHFCRRPLLVRRGLQRWPLPEKGHLGLGWVAQAFSI